MAYTETQVKTMATNLLDILEDLRQWISVDAKNYLGMEETLITTLRTSYGDSALSNLYTLRSRLNSALQDGGNIFTSLMFEMGYALGLSGSDIGTILRQLRIYYAENSRRVTSRNFTRGTPSAAGGNVGNGVMNRLTVDDYGFALETGYAEDFTAKVVNDASMSARKHEEVFFFEGEAATRDRLKITGTGPGPQITAISARESLDLMANCTFDVYQGAAATPDEITNWTPGTDIANFAINTSTYYRDYEGATAPASLKIEGNDSLSQAFTVRRYNFLDSVPYYSQFAVNRNSTGADGTLTARIGSITVATDLSTLAASGWVLVRFPIGTNNWYRNFKGTNPVFSLTLASGTSFGALIDDWIIAPYRFCKGTYFAPVGGTTKWLLGDKYTWTDTEVGAVINYFLNYWFGITLPGTTSPTSVTWADPA